MQSVHVDEGGRCRQRAASPATAGPAERRRCDRHALDSDAKGDAGHDLGGQGHQPRDRERQADAAALLRGQ